jgi:AcrR family transcriptional regulator
MDLIDAKRVNERDSESSLRRRPSFNRRGFDGCSMQDISAATGLEKGSLYSHFATKEELAAAAFDHAWAQTCSARVGNLDRAPNSVDKLKTSHRKFCFQALVPRWLSHAQYGPGYGRW